MHLLEIATILSLGALFRASGLKRAGGVLIDELRSSDETARQLAATMLMRAGGRARPTLREAAAAQRSLPMVLSMLGDLGDSTDEALLKRFTSHHDAQVQVAAKDALRVLHARAPA